MRMGNKILYRRLRVPFFCVSSARSMPSLLCQSAMHTKTKVIGSILILMGFPPIHRARIPNQPGSCISVLKAQQNAFLRLNKRSQLSGLGIISSGTEKMVFWRHILNKSAECKRTSALLLSVLGCSFSLQFRHCLVEDKSQWDDPV